MTYPASGSGGSRLDRLVEATPSSRDRYVDFLRAASITVVVLGHWLSALVGWKDDVMSVRNAVGLVPGLWCTTWLLQVMLVFFFIGGFSNYTSLESALRRGEPVGRFLRSRLVRLLKPTAVFLGVWLAVLVGLHLAGALKSAYVRSTVLLLGPLWFLDVYLFIMALTFWLVGAVPWLRRPASRWLARPGPWKAVTAANSIIITVYPWHNRLRGCARGARAGRVPACDTRFCRLVV